MSTSAAVGDTCVRCEVCQVTVNSQQQYHAHIQGKSHAKKLRLSLFAQQVAAGGNPNFATSLAKGDNQAVYNSMPYSSTETGGTSTTSSFAPQWAPCPPADFGGPGSESNGAQVVNSAAVAPMASLTGQLKAGSKRRTAGLYCDICDVELSSEFQAEQHYEGTKHAKKLKGVQQLYEASSKSVAVGGNPNFAPCPPAAFGGPGSQSNGAQVVNSAAVAPMASLTKAGSKRRNAGLYCDICDMELTSDFQAEQHFKGAKHAKKWKGVQEVYEASSQSADMTGLSGPQSLDSTKTKPAKTGSAFYCSFCLMGVNSQEQLQQHRTGAKHKKLVEKCRRVSKGARRSKAEASDEYQYTCITCSVIMDTESQYRAHLMSENHITRAVKLGFPTEDTGDLGDFPPQPGSEMDMFGTADN